MNELTIVIFYLVGINSLTFILMGADKRKAKKQKFRIRERTFWTFAVLGGVIGALLGMKQYRHKTQHRSFVLGMPALIIIQMLLVLYMIF